jgi:hypothetical protein
MIATGDADGWGQCHTVGRVAFPDEACGAVSRFGNRQILVAKRLQSCERALPPMTKTPLTALSARSNSLDDIDGGPECGVYTQMRGIEQVRVRSGFKWGDAAP